MRALAGKLRSKDRKVTHARQSILETLREQGRPMTNKEVHQSLRSQPCDLATVYRVMHVLLDIGLVQKFDFGDGTARYEIVHEDRSHHHHHLICTECSNVVEIEDCFADALQKDVAEKNGFKKVTHKLEFFGVCPNCQ